MTQIIFKIFDLLNYKIIKKILNKINNKLKKELIKNNIQQDLKKKVFEVYNRIKANLYW